jgi:hypothetical protein
MGTAGVTESWRDRPRLVAGTSDTLPARLAFLEDRFDNPAHA